MSAGYFLMTTTKTTTIISNISPNEIIWDYQIQNVKTEANKWINTVRVND